MPSAKRDEPFIELFLSVYENRSWADGTYFWPEDPENRRLEKSDPVEVIATRSSDGLKLAIEHTIIQPCIDEIGNRHAFAQIRQIERDLGLRVPGRRIRVLVPINIFEAKPPAARVAIVREIHDWIKSARQTLADGRSEHSCRIGDNTISLTTQVLTVRDFPDGLLQIQMQEVGNTFSEVVRKALHTKLPKLVKAEVDKRVLILERQHMSLNPDRILNEIEEQRISDPEVARLLNNAIEIWILSSLCEIDNPLQFECPTSNSGYNFMDGALHTGYENGDYFTKAG